MRRASPIAPIRRKQGRAKVVAILGIPSARRIRPLRCRPWRMSVRCGEQRARLLPAGQRQPFTFDRAGVLGWFPAGRPRRPGGARRRQRHRPRWLGQSSRAEVDGSDPAGRSPVNYTPSTPTRSTARSVPRRARRADRDSSERTLRVDPGMVGREYPNPLPLVVDGITISVIAEAYIGAPRNRGVVAHELGRCSRTCPICTSPSRTNRSGRASRSTTRLRRATTA